MDKIWVVEGRYYEDEPYWVEEYYNSEDKAFEKIEKLMIEDDQIEYRVTGPHIVK